MIRLITGLWIALGCAQLAHIITLFTDRSLQTYTSFSCVFILVGIFLYIGVCLLGKKRYAKACEDVPQKAVTNTQTKAVSKETLPYIIVFVLLASITIIHFCKNYVPELFEGTYDTVIGTLQSGNIMGVHPFIGTVASMPLRRQIIGLTSLYSALISALRLPTYMVLCKIVPICLWCFSMLLYWAFAQKLFSEQRKRWLFLCSVTLFYLLSCGGVGMPANQLFFSGFTGEAIRSNLLIPYTLYVTWQKKWFLAAIAVLTEACIVWTTYGVGYCTFLVVCMLFVHLFLKRRAKYADRME